MAVLTLDEKKRLAWLTLLIVFISIVDVASLALLVYIINFYAQPGSIAHPSWLPQWLFNRQSSALIALFFVFFALKNYGGYLIYKAQYLFVYGVASRISRHNLLYYLEGKYNDYVSTDTATHVRKINLQPQEFAQHVLAGIQQNITEITLILFTITAILIFNAKLFLLLMVLLLPPVFITAWFTKRRSVEAREFIRSSREEMWQHLHESITGYVESNIYDKNDFFVNRYAGSQQILNKHLSILQAIQGMPARLAEVFAIFGLLALISITSLFGNIHYGTEIVTLGAFIAAAYKIIPGIARLLNTRGQIRTYSFTVDDLVKEKNAERLPANTKPTKKIHSISGDHISFNYGKTNILDNLRFDIQPGDLVGIQGDSGKGKTTLLNILLGFLPAEKGELRINGAATSAAERQAYWPHIAYVKQQPFIIYDSLLANITLETAAYDDQQLNKAIDIAGLTELVKKSPDGIKKIITENGKNISGGQRKRIALARALYKDADLVILDEPFSELDEAAEEQLLSHFKQLAQQGKMIILITHNRKSLAACNKLITLESPVIIDY